MRSVFVSVLLGCAVFLSAASAAAQPGVIAGVVRDASYRAPVPGALVAVAGRPERATTRADGRFVLSIPVGSEARVIVTSLGYAEWTAPVQVSSGDTLHIDVLLREKPIELDEVVVARTTLSGAGAQAGATYVLGPRELARFRHDDVHRVLQQVPGVTVQEEDGFGLRPNIGLRGSGTERSSKITVMEDGVLMAPAPYSAPAAYYFPTVARMEAVEVRTGASQIQHGPYTTAGAINFVSRPVPFARSGLAEVQGASFGGRTVHAWGGDRFAWGGILLETYQTRSDGFKRIDGGGSTGFDKQDYLAKIEVAVPGKGRVMAKIGQVFEVSDETYLGLTADDFGASPLRRYAASQRDQMRARQRQAVLRYTVQPLRGLDVSLTAYRTEVSRNWYKLASVRADGASASVGLARLLADPQVYATELDILRGATTKGPSLDVKANNRSYDSQGAQGVVGYTGSAGAVAIDAEVGLRLHRDGMDRFEWVDSYRMAEGTMVQTSAGTRGTDSNRIERARAAAAYALVRLTWGRLTLAPGLRREAVTLSRRDFGKADPARAGTALKTARNDVAAWIPGLSATARVGAGAEVYGGLHRGFAPPSGTAGVRPEASWNYEIGTRLRQAGGTAHVTAFLTEYENLLGADLAAAGGTGSGDLFNGGAARAQGVEAGLETDLGRLAGVSLSLPAALAYTFTHTRFKSAFASTFEPWGTVRVGDELPYQPAHQLFARVGARLGRADVSVSGRYHGRMRTRAGQEAFDPARTIAAYAVLDVATTYFLSARTHLFGSLRNATNAIYSVADQPAGQRPGLPRTVVLGVATHF